MPYEVAADHQPVIVLATQTGDVEHSLSDLLARALELLGRLASQRGCDGVYGIQHTVSVDCGKVYITVTGTGSRPIADLDGPPPGAGLP